MNDSGNLANFPAIWIAGTDVGFGRVDIKLEGTVQGIVSLVAAQPEFALASKKLGAVHMPTKYAGVFEPCFRVAERTGC